MYGEPRVFSNAGSTSEEIVSCAGLILTNVPLGLKGSSFRRHSLGSKLPVLRLDATRVTAARGRRQVPGSGGKAVQAIVAAASNFIRRGWLAAALLSGASCLSQARAEDAAAPVDKSIYTIANPVPDNLLREFSTDRPGKSHSATTVDAGRFQIEADFLNYTFDPHGAGNVTTRAYSIGTPIIKLGINNWMDFEVGLALANSLHQSTGSLTGNTVFRASGFGDTQVGAKINLFGNDGSDQSLALLPFFKLPTAARGLGNGHIEFSLNAPYTIALSKPWSLTLEPSFGILRDSQNLGYRADYGMIANLSRPILVEGLTAAVEVAVNATSERGQKSKVSFDPSLQYLLTKTLQLDVGIYLG
jgi:hypothetical protein